MNATETKRRGRPPRTRDDAQAEIEPTPDADDETIESVPKPTGPPCPRCGRPQDRSTKLLKAYGMAVLRCVPCHDVAIEGDEPTNRFDINTAREGRPPVLASRAAALFASRHQNEPRPTYEDRGLAAALSDDWDDRWTTLTD